MPGAVNTIIGRRPAARYNRRMIRDDIVRFATRDWAAIARDKAEYWAEHKATLSPAEVLQLGDDLRRHARPLRPDWPSAADRAADAECHLRVSESLRAVTRRSVN